MATPCMPPHVLAADAPCADDEVRATSNALTALLGAPTPRELYRALSGKAARLERSGRYAHAMWAWHKARAQAACDIDRHWCDARALWCERRAGQPC